MEKVPVAAPARVGAKVTLTAQPVLAARVVPQVTAPLMKGAVTAMTPRETVLPPTFCTLKV